MKLISTPVFDSYWRFAAKRQQVFFKRLNQNVLPATEDPIICQYRFTNAYRALDRTSQYLIRQVIYSGSQQPEEIIFRVLLFKLFNSINTWEYLTALFGQLSWSEFSIKRYDAALAQRRERGKRLYSGAYIMPSGKSTFGFSKKHQNHLQLLQYIMQDRIATKITKITDLGGLYKLLMGYPTIGRFLAYQFAIDINYSELVDFQESEFVMAGPGARDGIYKCFKNAKDYSESDIIKQVCSSQDREFDERAINFQNLWGRPLQLIDIQNLFCEIDKYARLKHPEYTGISGRTRIKRKYSAAKEFYSCWFPPKWGLNQYIDNSADSSCKIAS